LGDVFSLDIAEVMIGIYPLSFYVVSFESGRAEEIFSCESDWQYNAYNGTGFFADQKPFKELRSVFSLHTETFSIAVAEKSNITKLDEIAGTTGA
jgi:TRAP-type uncharacterized transport system substrate-binding protein